VIRVDVLETLFDAPSVNVAHVALDGRFLCVNRAFAATHGLEPGAFAGRQYREIYEQSGAAELFDEIAARGFDALAYVIATAQSAVREELAWRFPEEPDRVVYYDWTMHPVKDEEGRVESVVFVSVDVTARHEARAALRRLADAQAALRRVATLVARAARPNEVFMAVAGEVGRLFACQAGLFRYEDDATARLVGAWGHQQVAPPGSRVPLGGHNVTTLVFETRRPARIDSYREDDPSAATGVATRAALRSAVGAPITVRRRLWGVAIVGTDGDRPLPAETEEQLAQFADLVATAIDNAQAHEELTASRTRIVANADAARRRIERDLHDGVQQRLVSLALELRAAQALAPAAVADELERIVTGLTGALDELREIARGIHPSILTEGGLGPALRTLARRSPIAVLLDVRTEGRLDEPVEVAAFYVVSETLANAAKHSKAATVSIKVEAADEALRISVRDDGVGGAEFTHGSGLVGLKDRVEALGGRIAVTSPLAVGTVIDVELPLSERARVALLNA
jgi:signal transduction histidine kinase